MQNAKDSFYEELRDRLASLNPERTMVVRGVTRPAIVVDENETSNVAAQAECFHLRWSDAAVASGGVYPLVTLACEITYSTAGNTWNGGLDRGRVLAKMDTELLRCVQNYPQNTLKKSFAASSTDGSPTALESRLWWSDVAFEPVQVEGGQLARRARVQVMCFEEQGEL